MTQTKTSINSRNTSPVSTGQKIKRLMWAFVERTFFRMSFHTWNRWRAMLLRMFGAKIGRKCVLRRTMRVYYPWKLSMGSLSTIGDRAEIYNLGPVMIGSRVTVSQLAYICAGTHDYTKASMPLITPAIMIEDDAWICALAFVGPGTVVGQGAVVAACSVVVKDVPPWKIVGGNPAKVIRDRDYDDRPDETASSTPPSTQENAGT